MPTKSQIHWLLAALAIVASTHCAYSHAMVAADVYHVQRMEDQPLNHERSACGNESACICKGATFAVVVEAPAPELGLAHLVCCTATVESLANATDAAEQQIPPHHDGPLISGSLLRAQLQRFLL